MDKEKRKTTTTRNERELRSGRTNAPDTPDMKFLRRRNAKEGGEGYQKSRGTCYTTKKMRMRLSGGIRGWGKAMISVFFSFFFLKIVRDLKGREKNSVHGSSVKKRTFRAPYLVMRVTLPSSLSGFTTKQNEKATAYQTLSIIQIR